MRVFGLRAALMASPRQSMARRRAGSLLMTAMLLANLGIAMPFAAQSVRAAATIYVGPAGGTGLCATPDHTTGIGDYEAIAAAVAAAADGDTIFLCAHEYDLSGASATPGPVAISGKALTFRGDGTANTILDGGPSNGLFETDAAITIRRMTLRNAETTGDGGAVLSTGHVTTIDAAFVDNYADAYGGAISADSATLIRTDFLGNQAGDGGAVAVNTSVDVTGGTFGDNTAGSGNGGAITAGGTVTVTDATFERNVARDGVGISGRGGAIAATTATLTRSSFRSNTAERGGGAVSAADAVVSGTSFEDNSATGMTASGGAIYAYSSATVEGSTFRGNAAPSAIGGAISSDANVSTWNSTYVDNTSGTGGGAIYALGTAVVHHATFFANVALDGTSAGAAHGGALLDAANSVFAGESDSCYSGGIGGSGGNVAVGSGNSCNLGGPFTAVANLAALELGPLQDNGGPTETMALGSSSPALDFGDATVCANASYTDAVDQRGVTRPKGSGCDAGAYEYIPPGAYIVGSGVQDCTAFTTIQAAVDDAGAADGGTIHICAGTYDLSSAGPVTVAKALTFEGDGTSGAFATIIDGGGAKQLFSSTAAGTIAFESLVLQNGHTTVVKGGAVKATGRVELAHVLVQRNVATARSGGAIHTPGIVAVTDGTFIDNTAGDRGGAIDSDAGVLVSGGSFVGNRATNSSGAIHAHIGDVTVTGARFLANRTAYTGGAIYAASGDVTVTGGRFDANMADNAYGMGGAIYAGDDATLRGVDFSTNSSGYDGGAVTAGGTVTLIGGSFTGNQLTGTSSPVGGGAVTSYGDLLVSGTVFIDNTVGTVGLAGDGGAINATGSIAVADATFIGNRAPGGNGGAIYGSATVTVTGSLFTDNSSGTDVAAGSGGAIYAYSTLDVTASAFRGNTAAGYGSGGALYSYLGPVTATDSAFGANTAGYTGGAIRSGASVGVTGGSFEDNTAGSDAYRGSGGAIYSDGYYAVVTVRDVAFERNIATGDGGAIMGWGTVTAGGSYFRDNSASTETGNGGAIWASGFFAPAFALRAWNSTFSGNRANEGGALYANYGGVLGRNLTFSGNTHGTAAGGAIRVTSGMLDVGNSLFATPTDTCSGYLEDAGGNIAVTDGSSGCVSPGTSQEIADAAALDLGAPALNAPGTTKTIALGASSIAIGYGVVSLCVDASTVDNVDQRGVSRDQWTGCDSGAYEAAAEPGAYVVGSGTQDCTAYGTIQEAVDATAATDGGTIHVCGTHDLSGSGPVTTAKALRFVGDGTTSTVIDGGRASGLFRSTTDGTISFSQVALQNGYGYRSFLYSPGAAIRAAGRVEVSNAVFIGNESPASFMSGGAIYTTGSVAVTDATFIDNTAGAGGAIRADSVSVTRGIFRGNRSTAGYGGAIYTTTLASTEGTYVANATANNSGGAIYASAVTSRFDTLTDNTAGGAGGVGGAIFTSGVADIDGSTFARNAAAFGGAVRGGVVSVLNATFVANRADFGGAITSADDVITRFVTFLDNTANAGYEILDAYNDLISTGTIFAGGECAVGRTLIGGVGNLATSTTCSPSTTTLELLDLQPLADNGGPTATIAITDGSVAYDAVSLVACSGVTNDQRGAPRPRGPQCDAGAFEAPPLPAVYIEDTTHLGSPASCANAPYASIQPAVDAAVDGDTIHICEATYDLTTAISIRPDLTTLTFVGDGTSGTLTPTTVTTDENTRLFATDDYYDDGSTYIPYHHAISFESMTFRGGDATLGAAGPGGAVFVSGDVTLDRTEFVGNHADGSGGAIWARWGVTVTDSILTGNESDGYGGAIYACQPSFNDSSLNPVVACDATTVTIVDSVFSDNASGSGSGGALFFGGDYYTAGSRIAITGGTFTANYCVGDYPSGGAIYAYSGDVSVDGGIFAENTAGTASSYSGQGGAIYANHSDRVVSISGGSVFQGNRAMNGSGGAVYASGTLESTGGIYLENVADYGGAISADGPIISRVDTFAGNYAGGDGGAIYGNDTIDSSSGTYADNIADGGYGGAIVAYGNFTSRFDTFTGNVADQGGGAVYANESIDSSAATYSGNESLGNEGGALWVGKLFASLHDTFVDNTADGDAGAVFGDGSADIDGVAFAITDGTFIGNSAGDEGGAIYLDEYSIDISGGTFEGNFGDYDGGAIFAYGGSVMVRHVEFSSNTTYGDGAAIWAYYGVSSTDGTYRHNEADSYGGAIYANYGDVVSRADTFTDNFAGSHGGAIMAEDGTVDSSGGTYEDNEAFGTSYGGAIEAEHVLSLRDIFRGNAAGYGGAIHASSVAITDGTFTANTSGDYGYAAGGAVWSSDVVRVERSTFAGNTALAGADDFGGGGAIYSSTGVLALNSTFVGNTAEVGAALYSTGTDPVTTSFVTFVDNTTASSVSAIDAAGAFDAIGTIFLGGDCTIAGTATSYDSRAAESDCPGTATTRGLLDLQPLALNAPGTTETVAIDDGSDAYNAVAAKYCAGVTEDQRGVSRPQAGDCDAGAYEFEPAAPIVGAYVVGEVGGTNTCLDYATIQDAVDATTGGTIHVCGLHELTAGISVPYGVTFEGDDSTSTIVDGMAVYQLFDLAGSGATFRDMTLRNGRATTGGAIDLSSGDLVLERVALEGNEATGDGGAVYVAADNVSVTIAGSRFAGNHAGHYGGAIDSGTTNGFTTTTTITDTTFANNTASDSGGALFSWSRVTVIRTEFSGSTSSGFGGAVYSGAQASFVDSRFVDNQSNMGGGGAYANILDVTGGSFVGNETGGYGGAAFFVGTTSSVTGATFEANHSTANGGAIRVDGPVAVWNSTFVENTAGSDGGAIRTGGSATIRFVTFVDNWAVAGANVSAIADLSATGTIFAGGDCDSGTSTVDADNLGADSDCSSVVVARASLDLEPLALNAPGTTETVALGDDSLAIDSVDLANCTVAVDQRGTTRPQGDACDAGAYELEGVGAYIVGTGTQDCSAFLTIQDAVDATTGGTIHACRVHELTAGITIPYSVTIEGDSSTGTVIDGGGLYRIIDANGFALALRDIELSGGSAAGSAGGAVRATGVSALRVRFTGNVAAEGGAVYSTGPVSMTDATFVGNAATSGDGGAIYATDTEPVAITDSILAGNAAAGEGGAIYLGGVGDGGPLTLLGGTFSENTAATGGAVYGGATASATIVRTSFTGNIATAGSGGAVRIGGHAAISDGTFTGNRAAGEYGGAVRADSVTSTDGTFRGNLAQTAGAIFTWGQTTLDGGLLVDNTANQSGAVQTVGTFVVTGTTFRGNRAVWSSGAFFAQNVATITEATFTGNRAGTCGAGVLGLTGSMVVDSTFERNAAAYYGGALCDQDGAVIAGSTFVENSTGSGYGSAILHESMTTTATYVTNSTFVDNSAGTGYGALGSAAPQAFDVRNVTFLRNTGAGGGAISALEATVANTIFGAASDACVVTTLHDASGNVAVGGSSCIGSAASKTVTAGELGLASALADNGGPTETLAITSGSAAVDYADATICAASADPWDVAGVDQRGESRSTGDGCDAGAFEAAAAPAAGAYVVDELGGTNTCADYSTIQAAVDATSGGTIHVCGTHDLTTGVATGAKDLTFVGDSTTDTIVDGGGTTQLFDGTGDLAFERISLRHGYAAFLGGAVYTTGSVATTDATFIGNSTGGSGGAIRAATSVTIGNGTTFIDNSAGGFGGAIYTDDATIDGATFDGNEADSEGGAIVADGHLDSADSAYTDNTSGTGGAVEALDGMTSLRDTFERNTATADGGAIYVKGIVAISDGTFADNAATGDGGAVFGSVFVSLTDGTFDRNSGDEGGAVFATKDGVSVRGTHFTDNTAATAGGAIWSDGSAGIVVGHFLRNVAGGSGAVGGALHVAYGSVAVIGGSFTANEAQGNGGAISVESEVDIEVSGATFTDNTAGSYGGAINAARGGSHAGDVAITDGTFTGNVAGTDGGAIHVDGKGSLRVDGGRYEGNAGGYGGALRVKGDATLLDVDFVDNEADQGGGGAIYGNCHLVVSGGSYTGNQATDGRGGAIYGETDMSVCSRSDGPGDLLLEVAGADFSSNTARNNGGAIYSDSAVAVSDGTFRTNRAGDSGGAIAAIIVAATDGTYADNSAGISGGAIFTPYSTASSGDGYVLVDGAATFSGNRAGWSGGAIAAYADGTTDTGTAYYDLSLWVGPGATFEDNTAGTDAEPGLGGAIFGWSAVVINETVLVSSGDPVTFSRNVVLGSAESSATDPVSGMTELAGIGGAIALSSDASTDSDRGLFALGATFVGNRAPSGGAIAGSFVLAGLADFTANTATAPGGRGGAIRGFIVLSIATFSGNSASDGGAIWADGGVAASSFVTSIPSFIGNTATDRGGAIHGSTLVGGLGGPASFLGNSAGLEGGAIFATPGSVVFASPGTGTTSTVTSLIGRSRTILGLKGVAPIEVAPLAGGPVCESWVVALGGTFADNSAGNASPSDGAGGAIAGDCVATTDATFDGNSATGRGGAIDTTAGSIIDSTFVDNSSATGGAIHASDSLDVRRSTFEANRASAGGSAVRLGGSTGSITNSTFADNTAGVGGSGNGAVYAGGGSTLAVRNATFVRNRGSGAPGAIVGDDVSIANSIFGSSHDECEISVITDLGGNLDVTLGPTSACLDTVNQPRSRTVATADLLGLGALALNAPGTTETVSISDGSAAIGYGLGTVDGTADGDLVCLDDTDDWHVKGLDQRGVSRTSGDQTGSACDSGAYENTTGVRAARVPVPATIVTQVSRATATSVDPFFDTATVSGTSGDDAGGFIDPTGEVQFWLCYDVASAANCPAFDPEDPAWQPLGDPVELSAGSSATDGIAATVRSDPVTGPDGWYVFHASYSSGDESVYLGAEDSGGTSEIVHVAPVSIVLAYNGPVVVYTATGANSAQVALTASVSPNIRSCPVTFSVDPSAGVSPAGPYTAWTGGNGIATTAPITFSEGTYSITVSTSGPCAGAPDFTGVLSVVAQNGTAGKGGTGGGFYRISPPGPPKVSLGYSVKVTSVTSKVGRTSVITTSTKGSLIWISKSGWRLKGTVDYSSTDGSTAWSVRSCDPGNPWGTLPATAKCARFSGTGLLQQYVGDAWVTYASRVSFEASVYDGGQVTQCGKKGSNCTTTVLPDYFGITMKNGTTTLTNALLPVNTTGTALLNSPVPPYVLQSGAIKVF